MPTIVLQFQRFSRVDDIPPWYFSCQKKLRVRMIRQCEEDPSVFYVYHTPLLRRLVLQDTLPPTDQLYSSATTNLLAVRPFGIQVDESSQEWIWSNFVSSHRYMTLQLLHRCVRRVSLSTLYCWSLTHHSRWLLVLQSQQ